MKTIQVRLPDSIHRRIKGIAQSEHVSMNQFIVTSVSNEIVREETSDFFREAGSHFDPMAFADALAAVPDAPPLKGDEIG